MRYLCLSLVLATACSRSEPPAALGFSLTEVHQLTSTFVTGCVLEHAWAVQFAEAHGRTAVVRVRGVVNATGEDLDTGTIDRVVAGELARIDRVVVAPSNQSADFLLTGRLSFESDRDPDAVLSRGHRRYFGHLALLDVTDGRPMCSATGGIIRWIDE